MWWLIVVGTAMIVLVVWNIKPDSRPVASTLAVSMWLLAAFLFITMWTSASADPWSVMWHLVISIIFVVAGFRMWTVAVQATEESEIDKKRKLLFAKSFLRGEKIKDPYVEEIAMEALRDEREVANKHRQQTRLDTGLIQTGMQKGLTPEEVVAINREKYLADIRLQERAAILNQDVVQAKTMALIALETRWREIQQDLDGGDLLDLSGQQVVNKLTGYLEELLHSKHAIEIGNSPPTVKTALLARYKKNIKHLEATINARQAGLLLSTNGQKTKRLGSGTTNRRTDYPPETSADTD
jgi:hypothetical protein